MAAGGSGYSGGRTKATALAPCRAAPTSGLVAVGTAGELLLRLKSTHVGMRTAMANAAPQPAHHRPHGAAADAPLALVPNQPGAARLVWPVCLVVRTAAVHMPYA